MIHGSWICTLIVQLYFVKLALFCSDSMSQNSLLNVHKLLLDKNRPSVIKFMHSRSFYLQNISKSTRQFSKVVGDPSEHWRGFAIQITQPHASRCTWTTKPVGRKQFLPPSFQGWVTEPPDGNAVPFIHAYSYTRTERKCRWLLQ